jgi:hypothetical protein
MNQQKWYYMQSWYPHTVWSAAKVAQIFERHRRALPGQQLGQNKRLKPHATWFLDKWCFQCKRLLG